MKELLWKITAKVVSVPFIADAIIAYAKRTPYTHIKKNGSLYMARYWLFNPYALEPEERWRQPWWRKVLPSIRVHHIAQPDTDRAAHDHPWTARTIILKGGYNETRVVDDVGHVIQDFDRIEGETASLSFGEYHQINVVLPDTYTLFITWKYQGTWGFLVNGKKVPWREYLSAGQTGD